MERLRSRETVWGPLTVHTQRSETAESLHPSGGDRKQSD